MPDMFFMDNTSSISDTKEAQPSHIPQNKNTNIFNPSFQQGQQRGTRKKSMSQLARTPEFKLRAERFLEGVGSNDNVFEYLRDSEYSLSSAMVRSFQTGNWTDEQKEDYAYLSNAFQNAEVRGFKERMGLAKDLSIDVVADPLNIIALMFAPAAGAAATAKAATETAKFGIKKLMASKTGKAGIYGAAEGSVWGGSYDYFNQSINYDVYGDDINWSQVALTAGLGAGLGGGAAAGITKLSNSEFAKKLFKYSNEDDIIKQTSEWDTDGWSRAGQTQYENLSSLSDSSKAGKNPIKFLSQIMAEKPTARYVKLAGSSETLKELLRRFRYDWDSQFFNRGEGGVRKDSYGLSVGRRQGDYLFDLKKSLKNLNRTGWWGRLTTSDNNQVRALLLNPKLTTLNGESINKYAQQASNDIRKLLQRVFEDGKEENLFTFSQFVENYFPRKFAFDKISSKEGRQKLINLVSQKKYKHAEPLNDLPTVKGTVGDMEVEDIVLPDAVAIDMQVFGKNFIEEAKKELRIFSDDVSDEVMQNRILPEARRLKATDIVDNMIEYKYTPFDTAYETGTGGYGFLKHRVFDNIPDRELVEFMDNNVEDVLSDYLSSAAQTIERTKKFGRTAQDFNERFLLPIEKELMDAGMDRADAFAIRENLKLMHNKVTGLDNGTGLLDGKTFKSKAGQSASTWGRLSQQMAHLPLAMVSSLTEPLILISRTGVKDTPKVIGDILVGLGKETYKTVNKAARASYRVTTGKTTKGLKDVDDDTWAEIYKTGLALEQSVMERLESLTGEALEGSVARRLSQGFFQANLLQQWTTAVQLASFTTGKRMIKENARKLHLNKSEGKSLSMFGMNDKRTREYLTNQLNELGVDDKDAAAWYQKYYKNGKFNDELAKEDDFYTQQYIPAANRFTKEVILNPSVAEANRPLWFSSPAGQLLVQFAGYPTVFNNTVLKKFVNEMDKPEIVAPKVLAASMLMTATAVLTNTIRSDAKNFEDLETLKPGELFDSDNFEVNREIVLDAVQRWGGLGIGDYGRRWYENYKIGGGDLGVALKTPTGPLAQDVIDMLLYRKGIGEVAASNLPFVGLTSAIPEDSELGAISFKNIKRKGRELDKSRKEFFDKYILNEQRINYDKGGLVTDVPQVPQEPDERIDKMTGRPYDEQAGSIMKDEEERVLVNNGGLLNKLKTRKQMNAGDEVIQSTILSVIKNTRGNNVANALASHANQVAEIESKNNAKARQLIKRNNEFVPDGPGRGKYQYEMKYAGGSNSNKTALTRYKQFMKNNNLEIPKEYTNLLNKEDVDFSTLPERLQDDIFYADKNEGAIPLDDLATGKLTSEDAWLKYHWAGKEKDAASKRKMWKNRFNIKKEE